MCVSCSFFFLTGLSDYVLLSALVSSGHACHCICIEEQISENSRDIRQRVSVNRQGKTAHRVWYSIFTFPICYISAEEERIRKCRGRIFALRDEPEVARVWLPHNDTPGLAMARAFGDFCLKEFGLISVPEISYRRITEKDEFIVLATDGVRTTRATHSILRLFLGF